METAARTAESVEEPATAWRTWVLRDGHLHSPYQGTRWEHGTALRARFNKAWRELAALAGSIVVGLGTAAMLPFVFVGVLQQMDTLESPLQAGALWAALIALTLIVVRTGLLICQALRRT